MTTPSYLVPLLSMLTPLPLYQGCWNVYNFPFFQALYRLQFESDGKNVVISLNGNKHLTLKVNSTSGGKCPQIQFG